jgi:hypothetical protein
MKLVKDNSIGVFTGISQQLFDFEEPVTEIADLSCHALPHSWGSYHMPNEARTKTAIFHLEVSPFCPYNPLEEQDFNEEEDDEDHPANEPSEPVEEYRPMNGDVFIFNGSTDEMFEALKSDEQGFIDGLKHFKLDQGKRFADNIMELHAQGAY